MRTKLQALVLALGLFVPGAAMAASTAIVTTDLNVRTGPGPGYQRYGTIPGGDQVTVYGCLAGYNWCDVDWAGGRGWVSGNYLLTLGREYYRRPLSSVGVYVGVPVLGFDPYDYHRRYYTGRSWYRDRYLDGPRRDFREYRRDDRYDRRDDRRGDRFDRRDDRRGDRFDRRDDRRGERFDRRDDRQGDRFDRRDDRAERGNDRFDPRDRGGRDNDRFDPRGGRGEDRGGGEFRGGRDGGDGRDGGPPRRLRPVGQQDF